MAKPDAAVVPKNEDDKKKPRNRKKKPKQDKQNAEVAAPRSAAPLNPHSALRNRLVDEGYSITQVDKAMEEMWDKNLSYDEFDSVLGYLKGETTDPKADLSTKNPAQATGKNDKIESKSLDGVGTSAVEQADQKNPKPADAKANAIKAAPTMTMEQRLETVANFGNLTDAIFALTEWIIKAAKPRDLEDLCAATKTKALVTIFQRSVTETSDQTFFDKSILPSMVKLMGSLLEKGGIPPSGASETQGAFEALIQKARSTYLLHQPDAMDFSQRVSRFIVSRISLALGESNASSPLPVNGNHPESIASIPAGSLGDSSIAAVLSEREIHMTAAKRYGAMTASACMSLGSGVLTNGTTKGLSTDSTKIVASISDIMLALVGEDAKASYELQKADLEDLKSQAKGSESENAQELRVAIDELRGERESVAQRILELKKSIEKLEAYDAELCVKVNDAQLELEQETTQMSADVATLNKNIQDASDALTYGSHVIEVANSLKKYDDSLEKAVVASSKAAAIASGDTAAFAGKHLEIFLSHTLKYFESETEITAFLKNRIAASSKTMEELKIEAVELEGLGLSTTIAQIKKSVEKHEASIEKDSDMLQRFQVDATSNFDSLIARLQEYRLAQSNKSLEEVSSTVLGKIRTAVSKLGVISSERLDPFMKSTQPDTSSKIVSPPVRAKMDIVNGERSTMSRTLEPAAAPKFTWATAAKSSSTNPDTRLSLLEIQKEELHSK